jgi:pyrroloquinoline quinone biosynthesis protein E
VTSSDANRPARPSARVSWSRPEAFGAWVRLGDGVMLAVDGALAERLGVEHGAEVGLAPRPLELHVAVTARCPASCTGCYLDARPDGEAPALAEIVARLDAARALGASTVAFGGGEPLTRGDLGEIARAARALDLVPVMTTSGLGMTRERARELGDFAQVNVSHDGVDGGYASLRGFAGASHAERAIGWLADAGVTVGVNLVLVRGSLARVEATAARVASLGASELQLLRYKPAGRAATAAYDALRLDDDDLAALFPMIERLSARGDLRVRVDCAMVPLLGPAMLSRYVDAAAELARLGVFGCEAGRGLGGLDVHGRAAACSFLPPPAALTGVDSRGSADAGRDLGSAWDGARHLDVVRAHHAALGEPCASCELAPVCRGGCQAVSMHARGALGPDPECPRVRAHAAAPAP